MINLLIFRGLVHEKIFLWVKWKKFPEGTILVLFDVINMFPSIDNDNGNKAVYSKLKKR